jgi:hypothetical protein
MREYLKAIFPVVVIAGLILTVWAVGHYGTGFFHSLVEWGKQYMATDITDQQFRHWVLAFLALIWFILLVRN